MQCIDWTDYSLGVNRKTFSSRISDQSQELLTSQAVNVALSDEAATDDNNNAYDMVLLTDCVFSVDLIECLIGTIVSHCKQRTTVICCHEIRDEVIVINYGFGSIGSICSVLIGCE